MGRSERPAPGSVTGFAATLPRVQQGTIRPAAELRFDVYARGVNV
jgi:hypothetical protein